MDPEGCHVGSIETASNSRHQTIIVKVLQSHSFVLDKNLYSSVQLPPDVAKYITAKEYL
jgi:hypothetical protein